MTRPTRYISIPAAAEACGISPTTLKQLIRDGRIPAVRPSKHLRVRMSDVVKHLEASAVESPEDVGRLTAEEEALLAGGR